MTAVDDGLAGGSNRLTPKERECLRLVLENRSSKAIARRLGISPTSVDTHIRRARAKLGLRDRYAAARLAAQWERGDDAPGDAAWPSPRGRPDPRAANEGLAIPLLIPPMEDLDLGSRLVLVLASAIFMALVFGIVLNAMRAL